MRYAVYFSFLLCFLYSCNRGQSNQNISEELIKKEKDLWIAWKNHNRNIWEELTANDYMYVGDDGEKNRFEVAKEFAGNAVLEDYEIETPIRCTQISLDAYILTYIAKLQGAINGKPVQRTEMEASVWAKRNGEWKNVFLHEVGK